MNELAETSSIGYPKHWTAIYVQPIQGLAGGTDERTDGLTDRQADGRTDSRPD
jgi:hypothetical protein